jgi:hypothetical protein
VSGSSVLRKALDSCVAARLTFAAFRRPGASVELWAQRDPGLEHVDGALLWEANQVFVLAPFAIDPERIPLIRSDVELEFGPIDPDIEALFQCTGATVEGPPSMAPTIESDFIRWVNDARSAIAGGHLEKVVLSRVGTTAFEPKDLGALFVALAAEQPQAMVALIHTPEHGFWFGASPERLVLEQDDHVRIDALAGTLPSSVAPVNAADWGVKETHEQGSVRNAILRTCREMGLTATETVTQVVD